MDWLESGIDGPLVVIRAIHFAATAMTTGTLIFRAVVVPRGRHVVRFSFHPFAGAWAEAIDKLTHAR